jgi:hypothetical protein
MMNHQQYKMSCEVFDYTDDSGAKHTIIHNYFKPTPNFKPDQLMNYVNYSLPDKVMQASVPLSDIK